jgi:hypothetical protein
MFRDQISFGEGFRHICYEGRIFAQYKYKYQTKMEELHLQICDTKNFSRCSSSSIFQSINKPPHINTPPNPNNVWSTGIGVQMQYVALYTYLCTVRFSIFSSQGQRGKLNEFTATCSKD